MTAYVVTYGRNAVYEIKAVFTRRERAQGWIDDFNLGPDAVDGGRDEFWGPRIEEFPLDPAG